MRAVIFADVTSYRHKKIFNLKLDRKIYYGIRDGRHKQFYAIYKSGIIVEKDFSRELHSQNLIEL